KTPLVMPSVHLCCTYCSHATRRFPVRSRMITGRHANQRCQCVTTPSNTRRPTIYSVCLELVLRRLCNDWRQLLPKFAADHTPFPRRRLWHGTEPVQVSPFRM